MNILYAAGSLFTLSISISMYAQIDDLRITNLIKGDLHRIHHVRKEKIYHPCEIQPLRQDNAELQKDLNDLYQTIHDKAYTQMKLRVLCIKWQLDLIDIDRL